MRAGCVREKESWATGTAGCGAVLTEVEGPGEEHLCGGNQRFTSVT